MAIGIGSSWSEDSDDDNSIFQHWQEKYDDFDGGIISSHYNKKFKEECKSTEDSYESTIKHFSD